jgi:hypothetical protein
MIDRLRLLTLLNVSSCWCSQCMWQQCHDIADGLESGDIIASADGDEITGLFVSQSGAELLKSYSVLPNTTA